jgi:predicted O-methyltransferase YrrM
MSTELRFEYDEKTGMAYTYVNGVKGTLNRIDTQCIIETAQKYLIDEGCVYLETGSYIGCSSILVALLSKKATVYAHDIWVSDFDLLSDNSVPPPKIDGGSDYFKVFYDNVRKNKLQNRVIPIRGDSAYTVNCVHEDDSVTMAFIDGDHSEDGILRDLNAVYPKIKPGGVILCHDCVHGSDARKGLSKFGKEFSDVPGTYGMVMLIKK